METVIAALLSLGIYCTNPLVLDNVDLPYKGMYVVYPSEEGDANVILLQKYDKEVFIHEYLHCYLKELKINYSWMQEERVVQEMTKSTLDLLEKRNWQTPYKPYGSN